MIIKVQILHVNYARDKVKMVISNVFPLILLAQSVFFSSLFELVLPVNGENRLDVQTSQYKY